MIFLLIFCFYFILNVVVDKQLAAETGKKGFTRISNSELRTFTFDGNYISFFQELNQKREQFRKTNKVFS